jgi:hypothetical protein
MEMTKTYLVQWTWRYLHDNRVFSDSQECNTEQEVEQLTFQLFHGPENVELLWVQKTTEQTWTKN